MNTRYFLLLERQQKLDAALRIAQARHDADLLELARLRTRKRSLRERLARQMARMIPSAV